MTRERLGDLFPQPLFFMELKDLKQDKRNYRKHNKRNLDLIKKSVAEVGLGRSVVIDKENEIICGNGLVSTLDKNTPVRIVETDGSELVVVKRTDLATGDDKRKQLAIMDNSASDSSEFDFELLKEDFDTNTLEDWGLEVNFDIEEESETEEVSFTVQKKLLKCPVCGHINEEKAFKKKNAWGKKIHFLYL